MKLFAHLKNSAMAAISLLVLVFGSLSLAQAEMGHPSFKGDFTLVNAGGEQVNQNIMLGKLSLVYFGYTSCLMQCPPSWITLDAVKTKLGGNSDQVQMLFISVDPNRDSVEAIAEWQKSWPQITALTGTEEQVHHMADLFHIFYARKPKHSTPFAMPEMKRIREQYQKDKRIKWDAGKPENYYMVDHTTRTFLLDRKGEYLTHFDLEEDVETILKVVRSYL